MGRKKQDTTGKLLTELELEVMQALWSLAQGTVKDVLAKMTGRSLAYTSVATVLKILETKKVVVAEKTERALIYRPLISRDEYQTKSVDRLVGQLFQANPTSLVMQLLNESQFSSDELSTIRKLLEERMKK